MAKANWADEIQAEMYKVKTLRARKHIYNVVEPGAPYILARDVAMAIL